MPFREPSTKIASARSLVTVMWTRRPEHGTPFIHSTAMRWLKRTSLRPFWMTTAFFAKRLAAASLSLRFSAAVQARTTAAGPAGAFAGADGTSTSSIAAARVARRIRSS
jgi:hypothetical protein